MDQSLFLRTVSLYGLVTVSGFGATAPPDEEDLGVVRDFGKASGASSGTYPGPVTDGMS